MKINKKLLTLGLFASMVAFTSCEDYFDTDPDNIINDGDYIAEEDEMYRGFLGIFNRVQEAGDQAIFLTDTRAALLETTDNAPASLRAIYNYDETNGNEYADPTCYYAIIVACNDYIVKMEDFYRNVGGMTEIAESNFSGLVSSALRLKCWAYLMLGKIYGEAYWFNDPLTEKHELTDAAVFTHCNMKTLADSAIHLLENGINIAGTHVDGDIDVEWFKWLDPETQDTTQYREWEYLTPSALILNAEFRSWRASYVDESTAQSDWQWIHDNILDYCYEYMTGSTELATPKLVGDQGYSDIFQLNKKLQSDANTAYFQIFFSEAQGLTTQVMSTIMYDYDQHQTNRLVQYLCPTYPDGESFYLKPSAYALGDDLYDEGDIRSFTQGWTMNTLGGQQCVSKYYYGYNFTSRSYNYLEQKDVFKIMPAIPTFRAHDMHFLLAEAEVHLGNFDIAEALLNQGLSTKFSDKVLPTDWDSRYEPWVVAPSGGYGNLGIAGTANAAASHRHDLPISTDDDFANYSEDELKEMYDWALADEHMKEYMCEGKSYSYLCKIAERYANSAYRGGSQERARENVASCLAAKYEYGDASLASKVRSYIMSNGYFINWQLNDL